MTTLDASNGCSPQALTDVPKRYGKTKKTGLTVEVGFRAVAATKPFPRRFVLLLSGRSPGLWLTLLTDPSHCVCTKQWTAGFHHHLQLRGSEGLTPSSLFSRRSQNRGEHLKAYFVMYLCNRGVRRCQSDTGSSGPGPLSDIFSRAISIDSQISSYPSRDNAEKSVNASGSRPVASAIACTCFLR